MGLKKLDHVRMEDHDLYYFSLGDTVRLELIHYDEETAAVHNDVKTRGIYRHFAIETDEIEELYERCKESGVKLLSELGFVERLKFTNFLLEDPNGVEIEIIKY